MIETRKEMQITVHEVHEVNRQRNEILDSPLLDMLKQLGSIWYFGIFSSCHPVLSCIEKSSTRKEPELQENLIRGSQNVMLAPPHFPLMLNSTSASPKEMEAFSYKTNVKNREKNWPDLEGLLNETEPETSQVVQLPPESETPKLYNAGRPNLDQIETFSPNPFQNLSRTSDTMSVKPARMRWTPELHDHFVEAINQLGGNEKATPSGILNLMKVEGLTIDHVESHLQKYSTARGRQEASQVEEGFETPCSQTEEPTSLRAINDNGDIDVNEALKIQMEVQKQLHEHLEMQRKLQMRLQKQGKHLKRMIEQQQHLTVDQSHASSLSSLSSNNYDDCTKERANQTKD